MKRRPRVETVNPAVRFNVRNGNVPAEVDALADAVDRRVRRRVQGRAPETVRDPGAELDALVDATQRARRFTRRLCPGSTEIGRPTWSLFGPDRVETCWCPVCARCVTAYFPDEKPRAGPHAPLRREVPAPRQRRRSRAERVRELVELLDVVDGELL